MGPKPKPLADRFWPKVSKAEGDACWLWTGSKNKKGYGYIRVGGFGSKPGLAHRVAFELENRETVSDLDICHRCDNPSCVRPSHLFKGTRADNMMDAWMKGRLSTPAGVRYVG
jgi:hypothetical protein